MPIKITKKQEDKIRALAAQGYGTERIAILTCHGRMTVERVLFSPVKHELTPGEIRRVKNALEDGISVNVVAKRFKITEAQTRSLRGQPKVSPTILSDDAKETIRKAYSEGISFSHLEKKYNLSAPKLLEVLGDLFVPRRKYPRSKIKTPKKPHGWG